MNILRRAIDGSPIGGIVVHLAKPLVAGKQEEIIEVGKEPGLGCSGSGECLRGCDG